MLERMGDFFDRRVDMYDEHQLTCIESADVFLAFTAECLPKTPGARVLDLGCGTGLELERYFALNPSARVVGVDLAPKMLDALKKKLPDMDLTLILGSYFDVPFERNGFDAAVSVESLHHFTKAEKIPLYEKVFHALKSDGYFVLTDYFAPSEEAECLYRRELLRLKEEQGIADDAFYHYDTPLTVWHEEEALLAAGFRKVESLGQWGNTHALKITK